MRAYSLELFLDLPVRHVIQRRLRAADDGEAVRLAYREWCKAPVWEHRSVASLRSDSGDVVWSQEQPAKPRCKQAPLPRGPKPPRAFWPCQ